MSRRLLTIKYDGTSYCGWQVQPNGVTVQSTVQKCLNSMLHDVEGVTGCSRTDSGVHANMFCLHFDTENSISNEQLIKALNATLPSDISALNCIYVSDNFHARYSAKGKNYIYIIRNSQIPDPFLDKYYLTVLKPINEKKLNEVCKCFLGTHDFKGFCSSGSSVVDTVRTVSECSVERKGDYIIFSITANGFLYNMVRIIVGTLLESVYDKLDIEDIKNIISSGDRSLAGPTAKPQGLFLNKVFYDEGEING